MSNSSMRRSASSAVIPSTSHPDEAAGADELGDVLRVVDRSDVPAVVLQRRDHRRRATPWTNEHLFDTVATWQAELSRSPRRSLPCSPSECGPSRSLASRCCPSSHHSRRCSRTASSGARRSRSTATVGSPRSRSRLPPAHPKRGRGWLQSECHGSGSVRRPSAGSCSTGSQWCRHLSAASGRRSWPRSSTRSTSCSCARRSEWRWATPAVSPPVPVSAVRCCSSSARRAR